MKDYLSCGAGVNSIAMILFLLKTKWEFESVFVDTGCEHPETYDYLKLFQAWLKENGHKQITVLKPDVQGVDNLYDYCWKYKMTPSFMQRWCTDKFKIRILHKYYLKPCFSLIGFSVDEAKRAKISVMKGVENRFPLIEANVTRAGCEEIIKHNGLPIPRKSGCYICPFQNVTQWKELRMNHPDLFCKAEQLEKRNMEHRISKGKKPLSLCAYPKIPLNKVVEEDQYKLFKQDEYPPCECMI